MRGWAVVALGAWSVACGSAAEPPAGVEGRDRAAVVAAENAAPPSTPPGVGDGGVDCTGAQPLKFATTSYDAVLACYLRCDQRLPTEIELRALLASGNVSCSPGTLMLWTDDVGDGPEVRTIVPCNRGASRWSAPGSYGYVCVNRTM